MLQRGIEYHQNLDKMNADTPIYTCETRDPSEDPHGIMSWLPVLAAEISEENSSVTYVGKCFDEVKFSFEKTSETAFDVTVETSKPKSLFCDEAILFGNTEITHFELFNFSGKHKLSFDMTTAEAQADVAYGGIKAFAFCEGIKDEFASIWNFIKASVGGLTPHPYWPIIGSHIPPYMEKTAVKFVKESMNWDMEVRETQKVTINPDLI